jgi:hypothetical protein
MLRKEHWQRLAPMMYFVAVLAIGGETGFVLAEIQQQTSCCCC